MNHAARIEDDKNEEYSENFEDEMSAEDEADLKGSAARPSAPVGLKLIVALGSLFTLISLFIVLAL